MLTDTDRIDERTLMVAGIAHATGLLGRAVDKKRLKERKARLKQLVDGQLASAATAEAVQAVQAAVMVAIIAASAASAASASS